MNMQIDWLTAGEMVLVIGFFAELVRRLIRSDVQRDFVTVKTHTDLAIQVADIAGRFRVIENQIAALPTQTEFAALSSRLGAVEAGVAGVQGSLNGIAGNVRALLDNALLKDRD
jgi:hypothetical protein